MMGGRWYATAAIGAIVGLGIVACTSGDDVASIPAGEGGGAATALKTAAGAGTAVDETSPVTVASVLSVTTGESGAGESDATDPDGDGSSSTSITGSSSTGSSAESSSSSSPSSSTTAKAGNSASSSTTARSTTTTTASPATSSGGGGGGGSATKCQAGTTHCVGPGQAYSTLVAAVAAAENGSVIELLPGRYNETVAVQAANVTIRSQAQNRAIVDCSGMRPARGKACILAMGNNLTVEHLVVTGARGPDDNEACFRNEPGVRYVVRGVECYGSNNGILGSGGSWLIEDSYFHDNGAGDGFSHNLYLSGDCSEVIFRRSRSEGAVGGHALKSRCRVSTIESSTLNDNTVADAAEFSNGGVATIRNSTISQPDGPNGNIVRHGAEGCSHGGQLTIVDSTVTSGRSASYIRSDCGPVQISNTSLPSGLQVSP